jgi:hypothetical protein
MFNNTTGKVNCKKKFSQKNIRILMWQNHPVLIWGDATKVAGEGTGSFSKDVMKEHRAGPP